MIIDISNEGFRKIFNKKQFELPIRWDGDNYSEFLQKLYEDYIKNLCENSTNTDCRLLSHFMDEKNEKYSRDDCIIKDCIKYDIEFICDKIIETVKTYERGLPSSAYEVFDKVMSKLIQSPIKIYLKSDWTDAFKTYDPLRLYRVVNVNEDEVCPRSRVFHTPYNLRHKVSTSRYSIAGYPSLYLGTSIELCLKELRCNPQRKLSLCSRFKIDRDLKKNDYHIDVIELAIKPQDFFANNERDDFEDNKINRRHISPSLLYENEVREAYLLWYPLIAACSFIRAHKSDPFAPEYVIPQLLMQWLRNWNEDNHKLFGLRYFSCASKLASDLGFNYVFPTSGEEHQRIKNYCKVLTDSFKTSKPEFVHEYESVEIFENHLKNLDDRELDFIYK